MNYVTLLKKDTGYDNTHEIRAAMLCRETWSGVARCSSASTGGGGGYGPRMCVLS